MRDAMKKWISILFASTAFAALPPLAQSTQELQALLADSRFYEALGSSELVKEIIRTEKGYLILTQNYVMQVDLQYGGGKGVGPIPFQLEFHSPVDLSTGKVKF